MRKILTAALPAVLALATACGTQPVETTKTAPSQTLAFLDVNLKNLPAN